jgi:hypothetical protein
MDFETQFLRFGARKRKLIKMKILFILSNSSIKLFRQIFLIIIFVVWNLLTAKKQERLWWGLVFIFFEKKSEYQLAMNCFP